MAKSGMKRMVNEASMARKGGSASEVNMSVGNIDRREAPAPKTSGIKIRGTGAATKGIMARGPMA